MRSRDRHDPPVPEHDLGLSRDLPTLLDRRRALALLGGSLGLTAVSACASDAAPPSSPSTASPTPTPGRIPDETSGPFPANGGDGLDVLAESGVVRSDLTRSFGGPTGVASGEPLTVELTVLDLSSGAVPLAGAAVYLWHCDALGRYSMYEGDVVGENYLRGVQAADADGRVAFTTVFPGAYPGRWPHLHVEVYPSVAAATGAGSRLRTSQLALPRDASAAVYETPGYDGSMRHLSRTSLERDGVFRDGWSLQLATMSGDVGDGLTARLTVPV